MVSSGLPQSGHAEVVWAPILCKCLFRAMCCVLMRKMVLWSFLLKAFTVSALFGTGMCLNNYLPVSAFVQPLSHSSLMFARSIVLTVSYVAFVCGCACSDPFFASLSALLFPGVSECPGIHCMKIFTSQAVISTCASMMID